MGSKRLFRATALVLTGSSGALGDLMLWPVLLSVGDLLDSGDRLKIRRCAHEDCGLLFVARTSGKPRKWCSSDCCNRATSRKYYKRIVNPKRQERQRRAEAEYAADGLGQQPRWPGRGRGPDFCDDSSRQVSRFCDDLRTDNPSSHPG